jgi:hypothetical protein
MVQEDCPSVSLAPAQSFGKDWPWPNVVEGMGSSKPAQSIKPFGAHSIGDIDSSHS